MVQMAKKWKAEVKTEHQRMVKSGVFEKVKLSELPSEVKIINTTWATKKKSNGTLCGRTNVRGLKQSAVPSHHYVGRMGYHIYGWSARQCRMLLGYTRQVKHQTGII